MSDAAQVSADAISSLLTGLARALGDAQELMAEVPTQDSFGRPLPSYQIPHLDFNFEIETVRESTSGTTFGFALRPAARGSQEESVTSTVSGRLVAVPANAGLPRTTIVVTQAESTLEIRLGNTAGEVLVDTPVELAYDPSASLALYGTELTASQRLNLLGAQVATTDEAGVASAPITRSVLTASAKAVILIRAAGSETRITVGQEA